MPKNKISQVYQLTPIGAAYLAGLIDGEGYIGVVKHIVYPHWKSSQKGKMKNMPWYSPRLHIAGTNKNLMEEIKEMVGCGTVSTANKKGHPNWKPYVIYVLTGLANIQDLLHQIIPYLKLKKIQAQHLSYFVELRLNAPDHAPPNHTSYGLTEIQIYEILLKLNKRGITHEDGMKNRAISDLIGAGEVSAEEME